MKKTLAIALALVVALAAVSSLALFDRGTTISDKIYFESVQISQGNAVLAMAVANAASVADLGLIYVADQTIYVDVILDYNNARTGTDGDFTVNLRSDNVTFPSYYYADSAFASYQAVVHYADVNEVLQFLPSGHTNVKDFFKYVTISSNVAGVAVAANAGSNLKSFNDDPSVAQQKMKVNNSTDKQPNAKLHVGFIGVVKAPASGATTGTVIAYQTVATNSFNKLAYIGEDYGEAYKGADGGYAYYVDVYENGTFKWRVYKLNAGKDGVGTAWAAGHEYLIQDVAYTIGATTYFQNYGIGFKNTAGDGNFLKVSYRKNMAVDGYENGLNKISSAATAQEDVAMAVYTAQGMYVDGKIPSIFIDSLYSKYVTFYGMNFAYRAPVEATDFTGKSGYTEDKTATFKYFGSSVVDDDTDIDVPPTGDASASVLIVLGASAILAAAALFFVMKKARD